MTYVHPQLITAHAPTIGAMHPTKNRDKDLADAIALEQVRSQNRLREIRAAQGGGVQPSTPARKGRQMVSLAETKADAFGKIMPGSRREIARIAPGGGMGVDHSAGGGDGDSDYKVTGTSAFDRPDKESMWDGSRWIRKWLPGEKEAEARQRIGDVENDLIDQRELSAQGRRERAALVNDVVESIKQGKFSRDEIPQLMQDFGLAEDTIRMADSLRDKTPTAEESFRKNTFTDANGVVFSRDGKMLYNPNDTKVRQAEFAAKQLDALKARADKFELELMKPYKTSQLQDGQVVETLTMRKPEEIDKLMQQHFPDLYPSAASTAGGSPIVVSPFDPMNPQNPATNPPVQSPAAQGAAQTPDVPTPPTEGEKPASDWRKQLGW